MPVRSEQVTRDDKRRIRERWQWVDGRLEGMAYRYDEAGWVVSSACYADNLLHGEERLYGPAGGAHRNPRRPLHSTTHPVRPCVPRCFLPCLSTQNHRNVPRPRYRRL